MLRQSITSSMLALCALGALAVPAKPGVLEYPQPDGTMLQIRLQGDEHGAWYESVDGYVLLPSAGGALEYASLRQGQLVSTGVMARNIDMRSVDNVALLTSLPKDQMRVIASSKAQESSIKARAPRRAGGTGLINNYPTMGSPKAMILLVEFQDVKFQTPNPHEAFTDLIKQKGYSHGGAQGSALDYFTDQSNGIFTPDFQVFGPITVPQGEPYYGSSTATAYDSQAWKMVEDACRKLHEEQPDLDWSEFDNDGDGRVDNIFVFYAGYGQNEGAPSWTIWPHSADLITFYGVNLEFNGVKVGNYACTNELRGTSGLKRAGIGTFCHEYSHVLGLPDYYPTNGSGAFTPGAYEVMDHGSYNNEGNTPPNYSAFSRYSVGWLNPRVLSAAEDVTLNPVTTGEALMIRTDLDNEYYILENRQRTGWDAYIPGHGMLVWHVDFDKTIWINNQVNNTSSHQRIDLVEADNVCTAETRAGDTFPGTSNVRRFTADTTPAMFAWSGYEIDMPITDIHENDEVITFKLKDGGERLTPVTALKAADVTPVSFIAQWEAGTGVYQYEVDVCRAPGIVPFLSVKVNDATQLLVENLDPATEYSYVVRAVSGDRTSEDSNRINVTTMPPGFEQRVVKALDPEDVKDTSFRACWQSLEGAQGYNLSVVEKIPVNPEYQTVDFTKDEQGRLMPQGWSSTSGTTGSLKGYYGEAAPALRLTNSGDRITTPTLEEDDVNSLSFWYRGNSTGDDATLAVEALVAGKWTTIMQISPVAKTEGTTVSLSPEDEVHIPHGTKAIRISFTKETSGSVFVDDIVMAYGASYNPIPVEGFDNADQGNVTYAEVTELKPNTTYYYSVQAYNEESQRSVKSNEVQVVTATDGAVEAVNAGDTVFSIRAADGVLEVTARPGIVVKVYDMGGALEASAEVPSAGVVRIPLQPGLHMVSPFGRTIRMSR